MNKFFTLSKFAALAPMAGVADKAFRQICTDMGAIFTVTEMASVKGLEYSSVKTIELLESSCEPFIIQLFGDDIYAFEKAVDIAQTFNPFAIDINMGCPAPKIACNGGGSALLKNISLAGKIVSACVKRTQIPITVKIRSGWDSQSINAVEMAKSMEASGASCITVHGRTRMQMYAPSVDLEIIRQVKGSVSIPVIGNGDITCVESARHMYDYTGCDLVMVGRAALGQPWIFKQIAHFFEYGEIMPSPSEQEQLDIMVNHIKLACEYKGEYTAMKEARRHVSYYLKGFYNAAKYRQFSSKLSQFSDLTRLIEVIMEDCDERSSSKFREDI